MATVTGVTSAKAQEIEDASVVSGYISGSNLYLVTGGGAEINAGVVIPEFPILQDQPSSTTAVTTTPISLAGLSLTIDNPDTSSKWRVDLHVQSRTVTGGDTNLVACTYELLVDGAAWLTPKLVTGFDGAVDGDIFDDQSSQTWVLSGLSAGDHVITVRATKTGGEGTVSVYVDGTTLTAQEVS